MHAEKHTHTEWVSQMLLFDGLILGAIATLKITRC